MVQNPLMLNCVSVLHLKFAVSGHSFIMLKMDSLLRTVRISLKSIFKAHTIAAFSSYW